MPQIINMFLVILLLYCLHRFNVVCLTPLPFSKTHRVMLNLGYSSLGMGYTANRFRGESLGNLDAFGRKTHLVYLKKILGDTGKAS